MFATLLRTLIGDTLMCLCCHCLSCVVLCIKLHFCPMVIISVVEEPFIYSLIINFYAIIGLIHALFSCPCFYLLPYIYQLLSDYTYTRPSCCETPVLTSAPHCHFDKFPVVIKQPLIELTDLQCVERDTTWSAAPQLDADAAVYK